LFKSKEITQTLIKFGKQESPGTKSAKKKSSLAIDKSKNSGDEDSDSNENDSDDSQEDNGEIFTDGDIIKI